MEERRRRRRPLILETPGERDRIVEDEAQDRPSSIKSLIFNPPSVTPRLASSSPATARRAFALSKPPSPGTSRATGLPRRFINTSSPRSTRSSKAPSVFFASKAPTSNMSYLPYKPADQLALLSYKVNVTSAPRHGAIGR